MKRIRAVTNHAAEYTQWFCPDKWPLIQVHAASLLLASGRGPARATTCKQALRHVRFSYSSSHDAATTAVLLRALSLFNPGELRELRVGDPTVFDLIDNTIQESETCDLGLPALRKPRSQPRSRDYPFRPPEAKIELP
jgi:hypothetical protein